MLRYALAIALLPCATGLADDWPQWMGPRRDNVWRETGIVDRFPDGGPAVLWRVPVAGGYSGPAVANGRVVLTDYVTSDNVKVDNFDRREFSGIERVRCYRESDGKLQWEQKYPVRYSMSYPAGPRCTPTVHQGHVYALGAEGHLLCIELNTGRKLWEKQLRDEYKAKTALWGYTGHPLVDGNKLICIAGGRGSHVVALDRNTGREIWRSLTAAEQGYSPPLIIDAGGTRQLIVMSSEFIASVDPETGSRYWSIPYHASNGSIIMTPVRFNDHLFVGGFSAKNLLLKLSPDRPAATVVWQDVARKAMSPVNVQPFLDGNMLYGVDQDGRVLGVELPSGDRVWNTNQPISADGKRPLRSGTAFIIRHESRYVFFTETGDLVFGNLSRNGFTEIDRANVIRPSNRAFNRDVVWSSPAFANKHAYIRNDEELICVDLAK